MVMEELIKAQTLRSSSARQSVISQVRGTGGTLEAGASRVRPFGGWASSLPANSWQPVPGVPLVIADRFTLAIPAATNAAFFRLAKP
jgi:hypothetical protein